MEKIAVFGVPRSGTSWLGQIFNSSPNVIYRYQPIFAYSFPGTLSTSSTREDINLFHQKLLKTDDEFVCQKQNISGNKTPQFQKTEGTHLVWKEVRYLEVIENLIKNSSTKIICIVRHPCGVIKSWMNAPKEFKKTWNLSEEWQLAKKKNAGSFDYYGYEQWMSATQMFFRVQKLYPEQLKIVVYESLLNDTEYIVKELFHFAGLDMTAQTKSFLLESTQIDSEDPYDVFRKNKNGKDWKNKLPAKIIDMILSDARFLKIKSKLGFN